MYGFQILFDYGWCVHWEGLLLLRNGRSIILKDTVGWTGGDGVGDSCGVEGLNGLFIGVGREGTV